MKELLDLKLTPEQEIPKRNNNDLFEFIEKISKDNELFKKFIVELVDKYTKMMDHKSALQDSKIAQITSKVSVYIDYDPEAEGLKIT